MRDRAFRVAALILGILAIPSMFWQIHQNWPLDFLEFCFIASQPLMIAIFLCFGLGVSIVPPVLSTKPAGHSKNEEMPEL